MKITIDTKEDSPEEIRRVIQLLTNLSNSHPTQSRNIFEQNTPVDTWNTPSQPNPVSQSQPTSMPQSEQPVPQTLQQAVQQPAPTGGFMNMFGDVEPVKENPESEPSKESSGWDDNEEPEGLLTY